MPDYQGTKAEFVAEIRLLVDDFTNGTSHLTPIEAIYFRAANAFLSEVRLAYVTKSTGAVGSDGISWPPLTIKTIASRRPAPRKSFYDRPRGLLTPAQDQQWKRLFMRRKHDMMMHGADEETAAKAGASYAWAILKEQGAKTKLQEYGNRDVPILMDNGRLFASLAAGIEDQPSGEPEQVLDLIPGGISVGTNVPYAEHQHKTRPLWPQKLPALWAQTIGIALARGWKKALETLYP